ncbi:hypothetical protein [Halorhabdus salina]|uniref:hypothetical protein n=1 Tax=Halorhabdus salina TaxID=2750670 RepID=UPI0015EF7F70|nr:hypothetical protein [Halorhabdus salina]
MTHQASLLSNSGLDLTLPVGVFGGDAEELAFRVEVAFPELPLCPVIATRSVDIV